MTAQRSGVDLARHATSLLTLLAAGCGGQADDSPPEVVRPVTVIVLEEAAPEIAGRLTGLAEPYREETLGFEVSGRVAFVEDVGRPARGPTLDADGAIVEAGDVLALLDATRYQQAFEAAVLARESTQKDLEAQQVEVTTVAQSELEEARAGQAIAEEDINAAVANQELARANLDRLTGLLDQGVVSQADYDSAKRDQDSAKASLEAERSALLAAKAAVSQAEDSIEVKGAQIERTRAVLAEYEIRIEQARTDLDDCILYAPYPGRITERHMGLGGYVQPGSPVVTLTMMDPIKVVVMATAEDSRRLPAGSQAAVFPKDLTSFADGDVMYGIIAQRAEVADSATRTFKVEVLLRNLRRRPYVETEGSSVAVVDRILPVVTREEGAGSSLFVHPRCVLNADDGEVVLRILGVKLGAPSSGALTGVFHPEAVPIERLEEFFTLRYSFQRIVDGSGLQTGDILVADPRPEHLSGAAVAGSEWAIRPGDIVPVSFELGDAPRGFYVPVEAIATLNGATSVFVIGDDDRAQRLPVRVHETVGLRRRIEADGLQGGARIVLDGVHYITDGVRVRVVSRLGS